MESQKYLSEIKNDLVKMSIASHYLFCYARSEPVVQWIQSWWFFRTLPLIETTAQLLRHLTLIKQYKKGKMLFIIPYSKSPHNYSNTLK